MWCAVPNPGTLQGEINFRPPLFWKGNTGSVNVENLVPFPRRKSTMLNIGKKKPAEILGKTIESAKVHDTFCDVEFRRTIGLNSKFR